MAKKDKKKDKVDYNPIAYNKSLKRYLIKKDGKLYIKSQDGSLAKYMSEEDGLPSGYVKL